MLNEAAMAGMVRFFFCLTGDYANKDHFICDA